MRADPGKTWSQRYLHVWGLGFVLCLVSTVWAQSPPLMQHDLHVVLSPAQHMLAVQDTLTFPSPAAGAVQNTWSFTLHAGLHPQVLTPGVTLVPQAPETTSALVPLERFTIILPPGTRVATVRYTGLLQHPWPTEEPIFGLQTHPGSTAPDGVSLYAGTAWYPILPLPFLTFTMTVHLPSGWHAISQGAQTDYQQTPDGTHVRWTSTAP